MARKKHPVMRHPWTHHVRHLVSGEVTTYEHHQIVPLASQLNSDGTSTSQELAPCMPLAKRVKRPGGTFLFFKSDFANKYKDKHPESQGIQDVTKAAQEQWKKMSEEEKAPFQKMRQEQWNEYNANRPPPPKEAAKAALNCRCSPNVFKDVIGQLSEEKKSAIEEIGFGSLLRLECRTLHRQLCAYLVDHINVNLRCLELEYGRRIRITSRDVNDVMGIPCSGMPVVLKRNKDKTADFGVASLKRHELANQLVNMQDADDLFKRSFAFFAYGTILCPTARLEPSPKILSLLSDVSSIASYNWAEHVLTFLCDEVKAYKEKKQAYIGGSMLFLMIFYLDRFPVGEPRLDGCFPAIAAWSDKMISERLEKELVFGGFGVGEEFAEDGDTEDLDPTFSLPPSPHFGPRVDPSIVNLFTDIAQRTKQITEHRKQIFKLEAANKADWAKLASMIGMQSQGETGAPSLFVEAAAQEADTNGEA